MEWKEKPIALLEWPSEIDFVLCIDENGTPNLKNILTNEKWFTISGLMLDKEGFLHLKNEITLLKNTYWKNGLFQNKRVVLHSREIRKKVGPFNPKLINYNNFISDLTATLKGIECTIFSSSIDKERHFKQYVKPFPTYNFCLEFVLERFAKYLANCGKKGLVVVESRGARENNILLTSAVSLIENGNSYVEKSIFESVKGIYFNPKRTVNNKLSFPHLEVTDLIGYEIYKYVKHNQKSQLFNEIEGNFYNFPNYIGYGMKVFPKNAEVGV